MKELVCVLSRTLTYHKRDSICIIKEIVKEFKRKFNCLGENTENYKTFPVQITKEVKRIHKNRNKIIKTIAYEWVFYTYQYFKKTSINLLVFQYVN